MFSPLLSFPLFTAGSLGDFDFGETGGVNEVLLGRGGDGGESDFGGCTFLIEFLLSRFGTRLQVGWRTGLPLILATEGMTVVVAAAATTSMPTVTLALELHILVACYDMSLTWKRGVLMNKEEGLCNGNEKGKIRGNEGCDEEVN